MARKMTVQKILRVVAGCALAAGLFVACKGDEIPTLPPDDEPSNEDAGNIGGQPSMQDDSGTGMIDPCLIHHDEGCACSTEGQQYDCRVFYYVEGEENEVACAIGYVTCVDSEWTGCLGVRIVRVPPDEIPPNTLIEDGPPPVAGANDAGL